MSICYDKFTFKHGSTRIPEHLDIRDVEKYEMNIYIKKQGEELQTVNHLEQNPKFQQNFLLLSPYRIFKHPLSNFIQNTYIILKLVSPLENLEPFVSVFFLFL